MRPLSVCGDLQLSHVSARRATLKLRIKQEKAMGQDRKVTISTSAQQEDTLRREGSALSGHTMTSQANSTKTKLAENS